MSQSHRPRGRSLRRAAIAALPIVLLAGEVPAEAKVQPPAVAVEHPPKPRGSGAATAEEPRSDIAAPRGAEPPPGVESEPPAVAAPPPTPEPPTADAPPPAEAPPPAARAAPPAEAPPPAAEAAPPVAPPPAAEAAPPPGPGGPPPQAQATEAAPDDDGETAEEPPARVGRLARVQGNVGFRAAAEDGWTPAQANIPLTAGNALYTDPGARAALQVNQTRLALDSGTDFQFARLDDGGTVVTLPRGTVYVEAQDMLDGETIEIVTPGGSLVIARDGRYVVEAGQPAEAPGGFRPARFSVLEGAARAAAATLEQPLGPGQSLVFDRDAPALSRAMVSLPLIAWATAIAAKDTPPAVVRQMTGAEDLGLYGRWEASADYGEVWYPEVEASWVPYRDGRWIWREPWGWTWLDDRPWGFAPFHYGRWVQTGRRWGWAPCPERDAAGWRPRRPVWAPALVAFVGGVALGPRGPGIGWVPLGPREAYYPWFRASPRYVRGVNAFAVRDPRDPERRWRDYRRDFAGPRPGGPGPRPGFGPPPRAFDGNFVFANRAAFTAVPAQAMTASRPLRGVSQAGIVAPGFGPRGGPGGLPALAAPPPPSGQTFGVTRAVAGRVGIAPAAAIGTPSRRGPPPQTHVPLMAGRPGFGPAGRPGPGAGPAPAQGPHAGPGGSPQPHAAGPGFGAAAGAAAGLGAAGLLGRQGGRPEPFAPAPGVRLQPGAPVPQRPGQPAIGRPGFEAGPRPGIAPGGTQPPQRPGFGQGQRPGFGTPTPGAIQTPQAPGRPGFEPGQRPGFGTPTPGAIQTPQAPGRPGFEPDRRPGFGAPTPGAIQTPQAPGRPGFEPGRRPGSSGPTPGAIQTPRAPSRPGFEPGQRPGFGGGPPGGGQGFRPQPVPQPQRPPISAPAPRPSAPAPVMRPSAPPPRPSPPAARPTPPPQHRPSQPPQQQHRQRPQDDRR